MSEDRPNPGPTPARKQDHLELCLGDEVSFQEQRNGLERYRLIHEALPELDLDAIDLRTEFLGHALRLPLIISSMTGGTGDAAEINRALATAAGRAGCAMGVGSQRAALEDASLAESFRIRDLAPDVPLFANLGAVQLNYGYGAEECVRAVEMIRGDGLFLHLNSLQEALQPEGDRNFAGLCEKIAALCTELPFPVLLKTTGNGLSARSARRIAGLPVAGLEVSGAGGTSWARIEALRSGDQRDLELFSEWGEDTAASIEVARAELPLLPLIAGGGIRHGVDAAKALALGADLVGLARPLLQAAWSEGAPGVEAALAKVARELRISCFYTGRGAARELESADLRPVSGHSD